MAELIDLKHSLLEVLNDGSKFEKYVRKEIEKYTQEQHTNLDLIIFSLEKLIEKINISYTENLLYGKRSYRFIKKKRSDKTTRKELMTYGAKVIFVIREFLNQEKLYFGLNITTLTGGTTAKIISQDAVIPKLMAVRKNAIGLTTTLEKELIELDNSEALKENELMEDNILKIWKRILELSKPDYTSGDENNGEINGHPAYPKKSHDKNVYIIFSDAKSKISKYYNREENNYFNDGWLWQWTLQLAYSEGGMEKLEKIDNSLAIFFDGKGTFRRDRELGTKQGDLQSSLSNLQIQAKMNNNVIIRFNTILEIVDELYKSLIDFKQNTQDDELTKNFLSIAQEYLIPSVDTVNKEANNIIENLLKNLPNGT